MGWGGYVSLMPLAVRVPYTYRDYLSLPDDGKRYELIGGDLFVSPAPRPFHQAVSGRLLYALMTTLQEPGIALVFHAPIDVVLGDNDVLQPDLVVVRCERAGIVRENAIHGPPDLVIEILSPRGGDRDRYIKRAIYARHGVPEYWIVDPDLGFVEQYLLTSEGLELRAQFDASHTMTSPSFADVAIPLGPVFRPLPTG